MENVQAAYMATKHLIDLGHRRIGFLSGPIRTVNRLNRLQGYRSALRQAGVEPDPALVWERSLESKFGDTEGVELGRRGVHELLGQSEPPTALLAINDMWALGAYAGARDMGRRIPDDLSIVGIDNIVLSEVVTPPLTTIHQPLSEVARVAVEVTTTVAAVMRATTNSSRRSRKIRAIPR
jgi:DNA-binding LacI/PurR family transcriptional regulator